MVALKKVRSPVDLDTDMPTTLPFTDRHWRIFDGVMIAFTSLLFVYNLLSSQGILGEPAWRPLQSLCLSGALLLQALGAAFLQRARYVAFAVFLVGSLALLTYGMTLDR